MYHGVGAAGSVSGWMRAGGRQACAVSACGSACVCGRAMGAGRRGMCALMHRRPGSLISTACASSVVLIMPFTSTTSMSSTSSASSSSSSSSTFTVNLFLIAYG